MCVGRLGIGGGKDVFLFVYFGLIGCSFAYCLQSFLLGFVCGIIKNKKLYFQIFSPCYPFTIFY